MEKKWLLASLGVKSNPIGVSQTTLVTAIQRMSHYHGYHKCPFYAYINVCDSWNKISHTLGDYMDWVLHGLLCVKSFH